MEPPFEDIDFDVELMLDDKLKQKEQPQKVEVLLRLSKTRLVLTWLRNTVASLIIGNQTQWAVTQFGNDGAKWANHQLSSWLGMDGATTEWSVQPQDESRKSATTTRVIERQVSQLCFSEGLGRELGKCHVVWWFGEQCQIEMTPACQSEASLSCRKCQLSILGSQSNTQARSTAEYLRDVGGGRLSRGPVFRQQRDVRATGQTEHGAGTAAQHCAHLWTRTHQGRGSATRARDICRRGRGEHDGQWRDDAAQHGRLSVQHRVLRRRAQVLAVLFGALPDADQTRAAARTAHGIDHQLRRFVRGVQQDCLHGAVEQVDSARSPALLVQRGPGTARTVAAVRAVCVRQIRTCRRAVRGSILCLICK